YPTNFIFSGIPEEGDGWILTDNDTAAAEYDPRLMMSSGPYNINSGSEICFDYAFPFAIDYEGSNMESLAFLREKAELLQNWFNTQEFSCFGENLGVIPFRNDNDFVSIFPNPSDGLINIELSSDYNGLANVSIISTDGKVILEFETSKPENSITISQPGLYLIVVKNGDKQVVKRVSVL
ncbi:MAG: T9SS type A sorting domain-containing protein, partial [Bacteroidales bacterium]|nr:T9SS type A sorting domain-containing protein [Bacteroidales bacterium]